MFGSAARQKRRELVDLLEQVEQGEVLALRLPYIDGSDKSLMNKKERERWGKAEHERSFLQRLAMLLDHQNRVAEANNLATRIDELYAFYRAYIDEKTTKFGNELTRFVEELGVSDYQVRDLLAQAVLVRYEHLIAGRDSKAEFIQLMSLMNDVHGERSGHYYSYGKFGFVLRSVNLPYPGDWNDLLALHFNTPAISSFIDLPDRGEGDVVLLAAQALRMDDFTQAQIALAYCNHDDKFRVAVGDVLRAELARFVEKHQAEIRQAAES